MRFQNLEVSQLFKNASSKIACLLAACVLSWSGTTSAQAQDEFKPLLQKLPAGANAIIAIDADGLRNSAMGQAQDWTSKNEAAYVNTPFVLPPEASRIIVASQLSPADDFQESWGLAVMNLKEPLSARVIARAEGGKVDEIAGLPTVISPNDAYFVSFSDEILGVMSPANRQVVSRWIAGTAKPSPFGTSVFLEESVRSLGGNSQIVMAIDLQDAFAPDQIDAALKQSPFVKDKPSEMEAWKKVLLSLTGVKLSIAVDQKISGQLSVEFGTDPAALNEHAKDAIINALHKFGVGFASIDTWKMNQSGNTIMLNGNLELTDLRKIMSLLELPSSNFSTLSESEPAKEDETTKVATASQKYFKSVMTLVKDLEHEFKTNQDARRTMGIVYLQRYADRIDDLPILNVDKELVTFGLTVAESLRGTGVTQGMSGVKTGVRKSSVYETDARYNNDNDYYEYRSSQSIKNQIAREEGAVAVEARFNNWKQIEDNAASMRVQMTQKYSVEF